MSHTSDSNLVLLFDLILCVETYIDLDDFLIDQQQNQYNQYKILQKKKKNQIIDYDKLRQSHYYILYSKDFDRIRPKPFYDYDSFKKLPNIF